MPVGGAPHGWYGPEPARIGPAMTAALRSPLLCGPRPGVRRRHLPGYRTVKTPCERARGWRRRRVSVHGDPGDEPVGEVGGDGFERTDDGDALVQRHQWRL